MQQSEAPLGCGGVLAGSVARLFLTGTSIPGRAISSLLPLLSQQQRAARAFIAGWITLPLSLQRCGTESCGNPSLPSFTCAILKEVMHFLKQAIFFIFLFFTLGCSSLGVRGKISAKSNPGPRKPLVDFRSSVISG